MGLLVRIPDINAVHRATKQRSHFSSTNNHLAHVANNHAQCASTAQLDQFVCTLRFVFATLQSRVDG